MVAVFGADLTYDGAYASFTVTGFSGYAVTVPEPGTLGLLLAAALGLLAYARRKRRDFSIVSPGGAIETSAAPPGLPGEKNVLDPRG